MNFTKLTCVEDVLAERMVGLVKGSSLVNWFNIERLRDLDTLSMVLEAGDESLAGATQRLLSTERHGTVLRRVQLGLRRAATCISEDAHFSK